MSPKEPVPDQGCSHLSILAAAPHSEPILSGPVPSLGRDPKLKQDLLCRGLSFDPAPEGCQEMSPAPVWHCRTEPCAPSAGGAAGRAGAGSRARSIPSLAAPCARIVGTEGNYAAGGDISPSSRESRGSGQIRLVISPSPTRPGITSQPGPPRCETTSVTFLLGEFRVTD